MEGWRDGGMEGGVKVRERRRTSEFSVALLPGSHC